MRVLGVVLIVVAGGSAMSWAVSPPPVAEPTPTTVSDATTTTAPATTTTTVDRRAGAIEAFEAWVDAVRSGDMDAAWEVLGSASRLALGDREHFAFLADGLRYRWASWGRIEHVAYDLETADDGSEVLVASGVARGDGPLVDERYARIPVTVEEERFFVDVLAGYERPEHPVPPDSGRGRRIVYSNSQQRVWLVEADGIVTATYPVSGRRGVPNPGTYQVYSKSEKAWAGHDGITMAYMVRFARGKNLPIGFHAIPRDARGRPLQSEDALGEYRSAGCVRQADEDARLLYHWAEVGTTVVVLP
jgi:hypothetical protein